MQTDIKSLKRKAKIMLLSKDIPPAKMEIVRALLANERILEQEKYNAIIDLVKQYPDKPVLPSSPGKVELKKNEEYKKIEAYNTKNTSYVYQRYKHTKLFKKRILVHANNKFGIGFLRRLIPSQRFLRLNQKLFDCNNAVRQRLYRVLTDIVNDQSINEPKIFNYCVVLYNVLGSSCLLDKHYMELKWLRPENFKDLMLPYFSQMLKLALLDAETKEAVIQLIDSKLRQSQDLQKKNDVQNKTNVTIEQYIHDFITTLRCLLYPANSAECSLTRVLQKEGSIPSFESFSIACVECLIAGTPAVLSDIVRVFEINAPRVSDTSWNFDNEELVRAGKDPESLKRKAKEALHKRLDPYDEFHRLLLYAPEGKEIAIQGFDDQRKIIDKRNEFYEDVYAKDIIIALEGILLAFLNQYSSLLDGTMIYFENNQNQFEGCLFSETYFSHEMARFSEILSEINTFRTNNPTFHVTRDELIEGISKKKKSLYPIERFMTVIGDMFYDIGVELFTLYCRHRRWMFSGSPGKEDAVMRTSFSKHTASILPFDDTDAMPIPFSDCIITGFSKARPLARLLHHKPVLHATLRDGIFPQLAAYCLQVAQICLNDRLYGHLDDRSKILAEIRNLS